VRRLTYSLRLRFAARGSAAQCRPRRVHRRQPLNPATASESLSAVDRGCWVSSSSRAISSMFRSAGGGARKLLSSGIEAPAHCFRDRGISPRQSNSVGAAAFRWAMNKRMRWVATTELRHGNAPGWVAHSMPNHTRSRCRRRETPRACQQGECFHAQARPYFPAENGLGARRLRWLQEQRFAYPAHQIAL
jgi:hypothetical protein